MITLIVLVSTYIITNLFGYIIHWAFHQKWSGTFYKKHYNHHYIQYPPDDFFSGTYRSAGEDSSSKLFILAFMPVIIGWFVFGFFMHISILLQVAALVEMGIIGVIHDTLHSAFHIKDHWLNKFSIFRKWVYLHEMHHIDTSKNYGIFDFMWDKICGSYQK